AWPIFPRDLVFGLLPLAVLAYLRAQDSSRWWAWSIGAGGLLGACALIQVQLLLPIPIALLVVAVAAAVLDRSRARRALASLLVTGLVAAALFAPWFLATLAEIRRNGGVALDSADTLQPVRIGFWDFPREFGLLLPLALIGIGFVLLHLRERNSSSTGLEPRHPEEPLVLVAWFVVPWLLAIAYSPDWPLEDALRPQRLWMIASQPGAILAAIGLVGAARQIVGIAWRRPRWVGPAIVGVLLVAAVPTMAFTLRLLFTSWTTPAYAHLDLAADRVPDIAAVLGDTGPRSTVLTYEDWSSLAWYETGSWVVAVNPPGYAKLAFDPEVFTGRSQDQRRQDLLRAFTGDPSALTAIADQYGADRILLARRDDRWGLLHQVAAVVAAQPGGVAGTATIREGNGTDSVALEPGARLIVAPAIPDRPIDLEIRFAGGSPAQPAPDRRARLVAVGSEGDRPLGDLLVPATSTEAWQVIPASVTLRPDERLAIEAVDPLAVQSVLGFVPATAPPGWRVATTTDDAVLLERDG
ncbi:MAG TPA: hypothetical protein VH440_03780, partial [Candidatus Limnocylindrales bacterium]